MDCREASEWLMPFHDGELDAPRRTALEAHLARCPACRDEVAALRATDARVRAACRPSSVGALDGLRSRVLEAIADD
ncbi:MAG: anti-sigma factor family protein, partial [Polyangiaceae bacterium]